MVCPNCGRCYSRTGWDVEPSGTSGNARPKDVPSRYLSTIISYHSMNFNLMMVLEPRVMQSHVTDSGLLSFELRQCMDIGEYAPTSYFPSTLSPIILQIRLSIDNPVVQMTFFAPCKGLNWVCRGLHSMCPPCQSTKHLGTHALSSSTLSFFGDVCSFLSPVPEQYGLFSQRQR